MSESLKNLEFLGYQITNLQAADLERLGRIIVRQDSAAAADLLDGIQGEFALIERELGLV